MRLAQRLTLGGIGLVLAALVVMAGVSITLVDQIVSGAQKNAAQVQFDAVVEDAQARSRQAAMMAQLVAGIPAVQDAIIAGDNTVVADLFVEDFVTMKKVHHVRQFQFHTPPATSFLRVHKPEKFGDDLSGFRNTVLAVNREKRLIWGPERGRAGLGLRGMAPISKDGQHLGSVEFGLSFGQAHFDALKETLGIEAVLFLLPSSNISNFKGKILDSKEIARTFQGDVSFQELQDAGALNESVYLGKRDNDGQTFASIAAPFKDFSGATVGVLFVSTSVDSLETRRTDLINGILIAGMIGLVAGGAMGFWQGRTIAAPVKDLTARMNLLADGQSDIDIPEIDREDEIGEMGRSVEVFREHQQENEKLSKEAEAEAVLRQKRTDTIQDLTEDFDNGVQDFLDELSLSSTRLNNTADHMSGAAGTAQSGVDGASKATGEASTSVNMVASAANQLASSIAEIGQQAAQSSQMATNAVSEAAQANELVQGLANSTSKVGEVVNLISDIAAQTNLLALNATIEAARAGEAGRGFAIVASEVKNLANQTASATEEISTQIGEIQGSMRNTVGGIELIVNTINEINSNASSIAAAVEEQGAATQEIARSTANASESTESVAGNMNNVTDAIGQTSSASQDVVQAADNLQAQSQKLRDYIHQFLVDIKAVK